jgi:penicillin amidase
VIIALAAGSVLAAPARSYGRIELIRDTWGIPHVFSDTDPGAMYGLGYACAGERGFQMYYSLRIIQGRLAEVIGDVTKQRRRDTSVFNDRKMRTFGFHRAARKVAGRLDAETQRLLRAYCDGVNDWFAANKDKAHPMFAKLGVTVEPWTPADCIASWWHLAQFFASDGTRDLIARRNFAGGGRGGRGGRGMMRRPTPGPLWVDDSAAVVQRSDVSDQWVRRVEKFVSDHGLDRRSDPTSRPAGPKFSHAWVVGGKRTTTGAAVLVSDPQTPVRNPSLWHEFHIRGKTFNARGVGVPGNPGILIGFNEHVAWGVTALGADQADLFMLKTDPGRPDEYLFDGKWRKMTVLSEVVKVKGGRAVPIKIRLTHLGPVVTRFAFARPDEPEVALKRVPVCMKDSETIQGLVAMLRADNVGEFHKALGRWHFPSANVVFGDDKGAIGYSVVAAVPVRSALAVRNGRAAVDGSSSKYDWRGYVPHDLKPHVINPKRGWIASGNHRTIESFYRIPLGTMTGSGGHSVRSWRLYERLAGKERFKPADVLDIHYDSVNAARREIVRFGFHLRDVQKHKLSPDASRALKHLEPWRQGGSKSDLTVPGAETAASLNTFFRFVATPLAGRYGGGESGLARFLTHLGRRIDKAPKTALDKTEIEFIDNALAAAWRASQNKYRSDTLRWSELARKEVLRRRMGWFESLDGFASIDRAGDLTYPPLTCVDGGTIRSQAGQSYTQYVPLGDVDGAMSILPPGHSDRTKDPLQTSTMKLWGTGKLHPAPLSRKAVGAITASAVVLSK